MSESAIDAISVAADRAHPIETGGILAGVRGRKGRPWITHAVEVPNEEAASSSGYMLPAGARPAAVEELRSVDTRIGYLGDWHSHPADAGPSPKDLRASKSLASDSEETQADTILMIAIHSGGACRLMAIKLNERTQTNLQLIAAGDLPRSA